MSIPPLVYSPTKERIIELISQKWPITARKIYRGLIREHRISITYQAIHKALQELIQNGILEKTSHGYVINKSWIKKLDDFSRRIGDKIDDKNGNKKIKAMQRIIFEDHSKYIKFTVDLMEEIVKKDNQLTMVFYFRHVPYPNVLSNEDILRLQKIMPKIKWTIFSNKSTLLDEWHAKLWRKFGVRVKTGSNILEERMIMMNDYIINAYTTSESDREWDKSYELKKISDFDMAGTLEAMNNLKYKTIVTVFRDKELSKMLARNMLLK
ncbi:MAG: hypothetical protein Q7R96_02935 [Nanoarchaeota archaeon]|nr:hypothetical protein [Nanoarchaeota archaeon]